MNAMTPKIAARPRRSPAEITECAHRHSISIHRPNCTELGMAARVELAIIRDAAQAGMMRAGLHAATILGVITDLAGQSVYADVPDSRLMKVKAHLDFAMEAARAIERVTTDG